jgi:positive regulator of sigma E activity
MSLQPGVFLLVIFYLFSIVRMFSSAINVFYGIQKVLSMLYMGAYAYIFARRYMQKQKEAKQANKTT